MIQQFLINIEINLSLSDDKKKSVDSEESTEEMPPPYNTSSENKEDKVLELDDFNKKIEKIKKVVNINNFKVNINSSMKKYSIVELKLKEGIDSYIKAKMNLFPEYKDYEFKNGSHGIGYYKKNK